MREMKEKMHTGDLYLPGDEEIMKKQVIYQDKLCEYNMTKPSEFDKRMKLLKEMLGDCGENVYIEAPFYSNFGGHPILPELREQVYQYNMPVHIGRNCWIGAGAIIMPGITIGDNTVIGAGSVVTKDIPANVVAVGNPCRVMREINEHDKEYYYKDRKITINK